MRNHRVSRWIWGLAATGLVLSLVIAVPSIQVFAGTSNVGCNGNNLVVSWSGLNVPVIVTVNGVNVVTAGGAAGSTTVKGPNNFDVVVSENGVPVKHFLTSCPGPGPAPDDPRKFPGSGNASSTIAYRLDDGGFDLYTYDPSLKQGILLFSMTCDQETTAALQAARQYLAGQNPNVPVYSGTDALGNPANVTFVFPDQIQINGYFGDGKAHDYSFTACVNANNVKPYTSTPSYTPTPPNILIGGHCIGFGYMTLTITNQGGNMPERGSWVATLNGQVQGTGTYQLSSGGTLTASITMTSFYGDVVISTQGGGFPQQTGTISCPLPPSPTPTYTPAPPNFSLAASCNRTGDLTITITNSGRRLQDFGYSYLTINGRQVPIDLSTLSLGGTLTTSVSGIYGDVVISLHPLDQPQQSVSTFCPSPTATPTTKP